MTTVQAESTSASVITLRIQPAGLTCGTFRVSINVRTMPGNDIGQVAEIAARAINTL